MVFTIAKTQLFFIAAIGALIVACAFAIWPSKPIPHYLPRHTLQCEGVVLALAFSPDSRYIASSAVSSSWCFPTKNSRLVQLWDIQTNAEVSRYTMDRHWPTALAFTPSGSTLIVAGAAAQAIPTIPDENSDVFWRGSGEIQALDVPSFKKKASVALKLSVYGVAASPDGKVVAAIGARGRDQIFVGLWNANNLEEVWQLQFSGRGAPVAGYTPIRPLQFSTDGRWLIAATISSDRSISPSPQAPGEIVVIDVAKKQKAATFTVEGPVTYIDLSPDGRSLMYSVERTIYVRDIDLAKGEFTSSATPYSVGVGRFFLSSTNILICRATQRNPDGTSIGIVCSEKFALDGRNFNRTDLVHFDLTLDEFRARNYAFATNERQDAVAIGDSRGRIFIWDTNRDK